MKQRYLGSLILLIFLTSGCGSSRIALEPTRDPAVDANQTGMRQFALGEFHSAQRSFEKALRLNRRIDNRRGEVTNLNNLGAVRLKQNDPEGALTYFEAAYRLEQRVSDPRAKSELLVNIGVAHEMRGESMKALETYRKAEVIARSADDRDGLRSALGRLGRLEVSLQDWNDAASHLNEAYRLDTEAQDERGMALRETDLGLMALKRNRPQEAHALLSAALQRHKRLKNATGISRALQGLARTAYVSGNLSGAEDYANRAFLSHRAAANTAETIGDLLLLVRIQRKRGEFRKAGKTLNLAGDLLRRINRKDLKKEFEDLKQGRKPE